MTAFLVGLAFGTVAGFAATCAGLLYLVSRMRGDTLRLTPRRIHAEPEAPLFAREWLLSELAETDQMLRRLSPPKRRHGGARWH